MTYKEKYVVANMVWPITTFVVADMVYVVADRDVADMVCGRYDITPSHP